MTDRWNWGELDCKGCGESFELDGARDSNTLCLECRKPHPPEPVDTVYYKAPVRSYGRYEDE